MSSDDELELLLSFQSVPETPPSSPSPRGNTSLDNRTSSSPAVQAALHEVFGYESEDDELNKNASMDAFREVVKLPPRNVPLKLNPQQQQQCPIIAQPKSRSVNAVNCSEIEVHSRLRIRNRLVSSASLSNMLSDLRFVPLQAIRSAAMGEKTMGAWATIGVLAEKGTPRVSSTGQSFAVWKIASLDLATISIFLFGEAFTHHYKEPAGCVVAVFNAKLRHDDKRKELSINISTGDQFVKLGTSVDYSVCKGQRKDGSPCTTVVNRQHGEYCQYHSSAMRQRYKSKRAELTGGNLATGLSFLQNQRGSHGTRGVFNHSVDAGTQKSEKPVKIMSLKGLKNVLSNADKVTTKYQSQGIRFLASLADESKENKEPKSSSRQKPADKGPEPLQKRMKRENSLKEYEKRKSRDCMAGRDSLIELDLGNDDPEAMAQALKLFGKDGLLH